MVFARREQHENRPGRPTHNPFIERFPGWLRDELLNDALPSSLDAARKTVSL